MYPQTRRPRRGGFTLIELLVVITVIGLLVALLLPAIGGAVRSARNSAVTAEINQLAQALADFKSKFGDYPPSRIILCENGDYSPTNLPPASYTYATPGSKDVNTGVLVQRSIAALRKLFPRITLSTTGPVFAPPYAPINGWYDFNGNAATVTTPEGPKLLMGDECLAFFLGGIPSYTSSGGVPIYSATGFGRDPVNPFQSSTWAPNRLPPMYEFKSDRLKDIDKDGFPCYLDSLATDRPFAYFSSYGGSGYDPNDVNYDTGSPMEESDDAGTTSPITLAFKVNFPVSGGGFAVSPSPNPYTNTLTTGSPVTYQQPQSFQIISAGGDGLYGVGGQFATKAGDPLPLDSTSTVPSGDATIRRRERDNLTNFHVNTLE